MGITPSEARYSLCSLPQGPASFGRRQALAHDHDAVLHVRWPGHGIIDHKAFLAVLVPAIPDGLGRKNVGAKGLGGELVVQDCPSW